MMNIQEAIVMARRNADRDPGLAAHIVRDYPELKIFDLYDLAWAFDQGDCTSAEAHWLLDQIEARITIEEATTNL